MTRSRWLALTSLAWVLTACTQSEEPSEAQGAAPPPAQAKAALEEPEPTFASLPTTSQLMEMVYANLRDPVDTPEEEEAMAILQKELESFQYVPPAEMAPLEEEEPVGASFAADVLQLERYLAKYTGDTLVMSCGVPPCIHYGDFDGDGRKDRVVQVRERQEDQFGLFFLLGSGQSAVVGAGVKSDIGTDTLWMLSWRRVLRKGTEGLVTDLILRGEPEEALIRLVPGTDGTVEVQATWLTPPTLKQ